ncbi:MAG: rhodanese-like domain-containing protein [Rhodospirillales bacterium]|nr:rhodanese-like domain-containing protein [Alphaproteobacteria bacterium]USO03075.1 MAG: rhodanese-like domain-containing protein [Rhodospirillales bacterium]
MTKTVQYKQLEDWLEADEAVLIDVREPEEFRTGHILYAHSIPLNRVEELLPQMKIPEDKKIVFQCLKGMRGLQACVNAGNLGHLKGRGEIYNLEGGIEGWKAAGFPVVSNDLPSPSPEGGVPIMRQVHIAVGLLVLLSVIAGYALHAFAFVLAGCVGLGLLLEGVTGWCGMGMVLRRMPWNKPSQLKN